MYGVYACGWYTMTAEEVIARFGQYHQFSFAGLLVRWDTVELRYVVACP